MTNSNLKKIELGNKDGFTTVSPDDYPLASQHTWYWHRHGYIQATIDGELVLMHRWLMGAKKGQEIDHINNDKTDNRRENLRFCTRSQNLTNSPPQANNTLGLKGVNKRRGRNRYRAQYRTHLGSAIRAEHRYSYDSR